MRRVCRDVQVTRRAERHTGIEPRAPSHQDFGPWTEAVGLPHPQRVGLAQESLTPKGDSMRADTSPWMVPRVLARRALDVACDSTVTLSEGAEHLAWLAKGRTRALQLALAEARSSGTSAICELACTMLQLAVTYAAAPTGPRHASHSRRDHRGDEMVAGLSLLDTGRVLRAS